MKMRKLLVNALWMLLGVSFIFCLIFIAQFNAKNRSYLRLPVQLLKPLDDALVKIEISGYSYSMLVDLGSSETLSLQHRYIKKTKKKKKLEASKFINIKGIVYKTKNYLIPSAKIGNFKFCNVKLSEEAEIDCSTFSRSEATKNRMKRRKRQFIDGVIGRPLFLNFDCFFDIPNSEIVLAKSMDALINEAGCSLEHFVQVPFDLKKEGIILSVQTDLGEKKLLLDTGATQSVLRASIVENKLAKEDEPGKWVFESKSLVFNGTDLGNCEFLLYEFTEYLTAIDGILGIEFFKKHTICLDFHNHVAYIQP